MKKVLICLLSLLLVEGLCAACTDDSESSSKYNPKNSSIQGNFDHGDNSGEWSPPA